jgi:hypothetical protein
MYHVNVIIGEDEGSEDENDNDKHEDSQDEGSSNTSLENICGSSAEAQKEE